MVTELTIPAISWEFMYAVSERGHYDADAALGGRTRGETERFEPSRRTDDR